MICIAVLNNLIVNGSARFLNKLYANDIDISGTSTFASLSTTGNATIGGTLGVTGATTLTGKLTVNNTIEMHNGGLELYYSTPYIDFHYGNSTNDYTGRIIGDANDGTIKITPKFSTPTATITTGNITTINSSTISNSGKITANDMEVMDTLKSYKWDISHVANLANDFTVSPTLQLASGATIQFTAINTSTRVCTFTVTDSSSISSDSLGGVTWSQYSKVKFTMNLNNVINSNCNGYLTAKMNSTAGTMTISGTLDNVTGLATGTAYNAEGATIMLYEVGAGSQSTTYPVGIRMTAYGSNKRSYIDIYGGTATSSWTTPHVRIGNVGGLTFNGSTLENQWGIYTDMGYFSGAIVSTEGKIGGFDIGQTNIRNAVTSLTDTSHTGIYLGTDGIRNYNTTGSKHVTIKDGIITANSVDLTGAIKATSGFIGQNATNGFTISNTAIYNPSTKSSLGSDTVDGVYVGKDGIALGKGVFKVTNVGAVTASNINATGGTIGGWSIGTDTNKSLYYGGTTPSATNLVLSKGTVASSTSVGGSTGSLSWMILAGNKFGVTTGGVLYASEANISGAVNATSLNVGSASSSNHLIYNSTTGIIDLSTDWLRFDDSIDSIIIGNDNESHVNVDYHSFVMIDKDNEEYASIRDLRERNGVANFIEEYTANGSQNIFQTSCLISSTNHVYIDGEELSSTDYRDDGGYIYFEFRPNEGQIITIDYNTIDSRAKTYTFGIRKEGEISGALSFAEGKNNVASGYISHVEGQANKSSGELSHAEGYGTTASGNCSHTEGTNTYATGSDTHAEGYYTHASGNFAHSEGEFTHASKHSSHAEGERTFAGGATAHAEGYKTTATGNHSHSQNWGTVATEIAQTAIGKFNKATLTGGTGEPLDPYTYYGAGNYAFIIGNGTGIETANRSNALTVDWNGVVSYYGDVTQKALTIGTNDSSKEMNITAIYTNSGAIITAAKFTKKGNLGMLHLTIKTTGAVTSGSNIMQMNLASKYGPIQYATSAGYYGGRSIIGRITAPVQVGNLNISQIVIRNASSTSVTLSDGVELGFTYILKDYFV